MTDINRSYILTQDYHITPTDQHATTVAYQRLSFGGQALTLFCRKFSQKLSSVLNDRTALPLRRNAAYAEIEVAVLENVECQHDSRVSRENSLFQMVPLLGDFSKSTLREERVLTVNNACICNILGHRPSKMTTGMTVIIKIERDYSISNCVRWCIIVNSIS